MMRFAIPFFRNFKYMEDENVQFNIVFKPEIQKLSNFIEQYGTNHRRINLLLNDTKDIKTNIKIIEALYEKYPETALVASFPLEMAEASYINLLKNLQIPFYFNANIISLDQFNYFLELNVCDIKIGGELGFFLKFLSKKAREKQIRIRVMGDCCQTKNPLSPSFKSFFIRPEDLSIYENFVDTFEFAHPMGQINTLYEVYAKNQKWYGKLNEIILGYKGEEDSRYILPTFSEIRCGCRKKCLYEEGSCTLCDRFVVLEQTFKDNEIIVTKGEQKDEKRTSSN